MTSRRERTAPSLRIGIAALFLSATSIVCVAPPAHAEDEDAAAAHREGPAVSLVGVENSSRAKPIVDHVGVTAKKKTFLEGWTVYNTKTCVEIETGAWTVNREPKKGKVSTKTFTSTLGNGACPGDKFPFAGIYYTWTATKGSKDIFIATWEGASGKKKFIEKYEFVITLDH